MFEPEELMARIVDLEAQLKVSEMAPPAAEQLIACLEGEIAKRDARIVELEVDLRGYREGAKAEADAGDDARAECRQLRAKLAFFTGYGHDPHPSDKLIELALINFGGKWDGDRWAIEDADLHPFVRSFAALKAQGTVGEVVGWYRLDRPYEMTSYPSVCATWHKLGAPVAPLYAAPAAPAADAPPENCRQRLAAEGKPYPRSSCAVCGKFSPKLRECDAAIAAHRAKGVV